MDPLEPKLSVTFGPMKLDDVEYIDQLERVCFPTPWPAGTYRNELLYNHCSFYWVARANVQHETQKIPPILAYGGYWLLDEEIHIVTFATHPQWRRRKLGMWMLINMLERARETGAQQATLEVRVSNIAAQTLYKKLGFVEVGRRKGYYPPTKLFGRAEDALLLTLFELDSDDLGRRLQQAKEAIELSLSG